MPEVGSLFVRLRADASEFEQVMQGVSGKVKDTGKGIQDVGGNLSKWITLPLTGVATAALTVGANFDSQMSRVQALSGGTETDLESLRQTALDLGSTTQFSASQAAQGMEALALGGFDANQIIQAMPGLLNLAAAEQMDLGTAAGITTGIMNTFGISAENGARVSDQLLAASSSSAVSVEELGESLVYAGPAAAAAGMSLGETTAALGVMADMGLTGSMAGTTLNAMLRDMTGAAKDGAIAIGDNSVAIYDAAGNMRPFGDILRDIETATSGMSTEQRNAALAGVFQQQSLRGVNMFLQAGSKRYDEINTAIENSNGLAERQASIMNNNLKGGWDEVTSAVEGLLIQLSDALKPVVMGVIFPMIQTFIGWLSRLVEWFSNLNPTIQTVVLAILGIAAAVGPVLVGIGLFVTLIGTAMGALALIMSPILLVVVAIGLIAAALVLAYTQSETFRNIVNGVFNAILTTVQTVIPIIVGFLGTAWQTILTVVQTVWPYIQTAVQTALTTIQGIIETVIPMIVPPIQNAFNSVLTFAQSTWPVIQTAVQTAISAVQTAIETAMPIIQTIVQTVFGGILQLAQENWPTIQQIIQTAAEIIQTVVTTVMTAVQTIVTTVFDVVRSLAETVWPAVQTVIETVMGVVQSVVETVLGIVKGVWDDTHGQLRDLAQQVWDTIRGIIDGALTTIQGILETVMGIISGDWGRAWDGIKTTLDGIWTIIKSIVQLAIEALKTTMQLGWSAIKQTVQTAWDGIKQSVSDAIGRVVQMVSELPGKITGALGDLGSLLWSAGADLIGGLISGITSKIGELTSTLGGITDLIPDWKGPPDRDARLLEPSGRLIMQGLGRGLELGSQDVERQLAAFTGDLAGAGSPGRNGAGLGVNFYGPVDIVADSRANAERGAGDLAWGVAAALRSRGVPT